MKSGLNGVARPRFGPILSGNAAGDSPMLLVALEPPKTFKNLMKNVKIHDLQGSGGTPS